MGKEDKPKSGTYRYIQKGMPVVKEAVNIEYLKKRAVLATQHKDDAANDSGTSNERKKIGLLKFIKAIMGKILK